MNVLVVDDSSTMRKIIVRSLQAVGIPSAHEAGDGAEALTHFRNHDFELVLTDWNMPNKTGIELARDIRALGNQVPIIMITTEAEKDRVLEAIQAGVNDYLIKPFTSETLRQKIDRFVMC